MNTNFKLNTKTQVAAGDWVYFLQGAMQVFAMICDNKRESGGCCVYFYNPYFPDGHEAGWMNDDMCNAAKRMAKINVPSLPKDVLEAAAKFLKLSIAYDFQ